MVPQSRRQYTLDDYVSMQRGVELKLEYFNGEIYAMAGRSANHNRISLNILRVFADALAGSSCEAFGSDMRVSTPSGLYTSLRQVEHRRLEPDGSWSHEIKESSDQNVHLSEVAIDLPVARIYEGVEIS